MDSPRVRPFRGATAGPTWCRHSAPLALSGRVVLSAPCGRHLPGIPVYVAATIVGLVNAYAGLTVLCPIAFFFLLPYGSVPDAEALTGTTGR